MIEIDEMRDFIIVEKSNSKNIEAGSELYCGCCGESLGQVVDEMKFPFNSDQLVTNLTNKTFSQTLFGLMHETCGHTMFSFRKDYAFISLDAYKKEVKKLHKK